MVDFIRFTLWLWKKLESFSLFSKGYPFTKINEFLIILTLLDIHLRDFDFEKFHLLSTLRYHISISIENIDDHHSDQIWYFVLVFFWMWSLHFKVCFWSFQIFFRLCWMEFDLFMTFLGQMWKFHLIGDFSIFSLFFGYKQIFFWICLDQNGLFWSCFFENLRVGFSWWFSYFYHHFDQKTKLFWIILDKIWLLSVIIFENLKLVFSWWF